MRTAALPPATNAGLGGAGEFSSVIALNGRLPDPTASPLAPYIHHPYNLKMSALLFEWDPHKAARNLRKHKVSFEDAQTVFSDERALLIDDPDHSETEDRFVLLGLSHSLRLLVVVHCYRADDNVIRIISARKANNDEQCLYP